MNLEYLKPVLGDELYENFQSRMADAKGITLVNAADGSYVPKAKFDSELAAKRQYLSQVEALGKEKAALDTEVVRLRDALTQAGERDADREKAAAKDSETITKLQGQLKKVTEDLDERKNAFKEASTEASSYKGEVERLTAALAERDRDIANIRKQGRLSGLLRQAGARNPDMLMRMIDLDRVQEEDGKISGLEEQLTALKTSDPYLFSDRPAPRGGVDAGDRARQIKGEDSINSQVNLEIRRAAGLNV